MDWSESNSSATFTTATTSLQCDNGEETTSEQFFCGDDISHITLESFLLPDFDGNASQRSILLARSSLDTSFGFAIQSYVFKRASLGSYERVTYVDYVSSSSPASRAGVRKGDMVIAVNGKCVVSSSHSEIVNAISQSLHVTLVLVFKDVARIVSLTMRSIQLKFLLKEKEREFAILEEQEERLLEKVGNDENEIYYEVDENTEDDRKNAGKDDINEKYHHIIRINSESSFGSHLVTRL